MRRLTKLPALGSALVYEQWEVWRSSRDFSCVQEFRAQDKVGHSEASGTFLASDPE